MCNFIKKTKPNKKQMTKQNKNKQQEKTQSQDTVEKLKKC